MLPRGTDFTPERFFNEVVVTGERFLDYSALDIGMGDHGAVTHLIQDHAVDLALKGTGVTAQGFRALLARAVDANGAPIGDMVWMATYDHFGGINSPETIYPVIRKAVPMP